MSTTTLELQRPSRASTTNSIAPQTRSSDYENTRARRSSDDEAPSTDASLAIPDGGQSAYTVLFSCALFTFWLNGLGNSWGVVQAALLNQGLTSTATLSFVGSLSITFSVILSLLSVRFMCLVGAKWAGLIGVTLLGLGQLTSGFMTSNVAGLFGTTGILFGTGSSLCFMVASVLPSQYFSSKLGLANGLVKFAGSIGGTILSISLNKLILRVGTAWTLRIVGICCLATGIPVAFLVKEHNPRRGRAPFFDFSLFRNLSFTFIFLAGATGVFALFVPPFFLPLFAQSLGLSSTVGAYLTAGFNFCAAVGKLGSGVLCDRIGAVNTLLLAMLLNAISMLAIWPVSNILPTLSIFAIINGMANGAFFTALPTVVTQIYGPSRAGVAMGMTITGWSVGFFMGAPIAGYLLQAAGGAKAGSISPYRPAIFYAGSIALVSATFVLVARLRLDPKLLKKV
ncbi:Aspyridones efflux protein apdF [Lachnellula cervina]|uniref:Aspyridones efflux protein apdF n=1 Tax=Lachnellula cervina TaxID=1316786 RepID=A0A7D8YRC5_9HELO|nr:Aspyridones efflux protein apdF [Lachnellula cervina]